MTATHRDCSGELFVASHIKDEEYGFVEVYGCRRCHIRTMQPESPEWDAAFERAGGNDNHQEDR